jgi:hypothetical protein
LRNLAGSSCSGVEVKISYFISLKMPADQIQYSEKYYDDKYEYR